MKRVSLRRALVASVAAGAALLAVAACSSSPASSTPSDAAAANSTAPFALRVGFISNTPTPVGPEGLAYHNGTLLKGLKSLGATSVSFTAFPNGPNLMAAMAGGSIDIGILGDTPAVTAKADGINTRLINQSFVGLDTYLYSSKGGPTSIAQLKGKTVATQVGSYMYRYLVTLLNQEGLSSSVKVTNIYTTAAAAALESGGIAAYAAPAGQETAILSNAGYSILDKASADHTSLLGTDVTVITAGELAAHPGLPHAWNEVRDQAIATMNANPTAYYTWAAAADQTSVSALETSSPLSGYPTTPFTSNGIGLLQDVNTFLQSNKLTKAAVSVTGWEVPTP
ncbi:MAG TPA: ABC transporter substrate-binding protein [Trebonia sp.]